METFINLKDRLTKPQWWRAIWEGEEDYNEHRDYKAEDCRGLAKDVRNKIAGVGTRDLLKTTFQHIDDIKDPLEEVLHLSETAINIMGEKFGYAKIESLIQSIDHIPETIQNKIVEKAMEPAITATNQLQEQANSAANSAARNKANEKNGWVVQVNTDD